MTDLNAKLSDEARHILRTTVIDLDAFLDLSNEDRAARWRQFERDAKFQLCALMLTRHFGDWEAEAVEHWIAKYDARWEVASPDSDLTIPPAAQILAVVKDRYDLAVAHDDYAGAGQLDRARTNLIRGSRLCWTLGDLLIQSVNNPGQVYSVSARGCTCPNGRSGRHDCWHVSLFDLLIDMADEAAATADMVADAAVAEDDEPENDPNDGEDHEDLSIQYDNIPYPDGIGNPDAGDTPTDDDALPWSETARESWAEHEAEQRLWGRVARIRAQYLRAA